MNWQFDKIEHYSVAFWIMRVVTFIGIWLLLCQTHHWWAKFWIVGWFILLIIAAAAKELIYDKLLKKGHPEWNDFRAAWIGALDGLFIWKQKTH